MDTAHLVWQGGMLMICQLLRRGLILGVLLSCSTGCETLHSMVRGHDKDQASKEDINDPASPKAVGSDASKLNSVNSTDSDPQPFFKKTRPSSSWSSWSPEARDIEKDLGVY